MKLAVLSIIFTYLIVVTLVGIPITMKLTGVSQTERGVFYLSTHESVIKLMLRSKLDLNCQEENKNVCVRPKDYSHLKTHLPIQIESCQSGIELPRCDDLLLRLSFTSPELLKIGLRL